MPLQEVLDIAEQKSSDAMPLMTAVRAKSTFRYGGSNGGSLKSNNDFQKLFDPCKQ